MVLGSLDKKGALAWLACALLNAGLCLTLGGALLPFWPQVRWLTALTPLGALLEVLAILAFAAHAWPRIKPFTQERHLHEG